MREGKDMHEPVKNSGPSRSGWENQFSDADLDGLLAELKAPEEVSPRPGFYARVMDRIEGQRNKSIWGFFLEPWFGRRLAMASGVLMLLLGAAIFVPGSEFDEGLAAKGQVEIVVNEALVAPFLATDSPEHDHDAVLVNLVTYQEH